MNILDAASDAGLKIINQGAGAEREISSIYCCDLLSIVMGRAPQDCAWITVMANNNTIAVADLADVSCVILSEGVLLDSDSLNKAQEQEVCVLASDLPTYETAKLIEKYVKV